MVHDEIVLRRADGRTGCSGYRPGRRHRGRHDHRRAAAGAGRDEADPTIPRALATVDIATGEAAAAINQRSDVCAVPAAGVVAEAMVALVLADAALEKFGGDSVAETRRNFAGLPRLAAASGEPRCVVLVGPPGAGKSTVGPRGGRRARGRLPRHRRRHRGRRPGSPSPTSSSSEGEPHFRALEEAAVARALAEHDGRAGLGGGAVLDAATRQLLVG